MARRKTQYAPSEERVRPAESAGQTAYGYEIRCRSLQFQDHVLHIGLKYPENAKSPSRTLDFASAYLPPNRLHPGVTLLKDRPDLARVVVAVVDVYMIRQQDTKSTAGTAMSLAGTVIRLLEYCWLNDIYHLKDITSSRWDDFLQKYAKGGWHMVLDLQRRASVIDLRTLRLTRRRHKKGVVEYSSSSLLEAIGANLSESQVRLEYTRGATTGLLLPARSSKGPTESAISQVVSQLNNLVDIPKDMRARSLSHASPYLFAASVGAAQPNRTENFEPGRLASLLCEAYRWVTAYAEPVIELANRVYSDLSLYEREEVDESRLLIVLEARETKTLEAMLGVRVTSVRRMGDWRQGIGLLGLLRVVLASCFVLLGVFNGRRKDEIQSRSIGLYSDGFQCLDKGLGLFQATFYCEKTSQDYRDFYINEISFKALTTATSLSEIAWNEVARNGGEVQSGRAHKVFCMPPRAGEQAPVWYDYSSDPGIELLTQRATGSSEPVVPNAHMFRRAYAVVFYYRYENAELYALSQQLDQWDLNVTLHYVLEGASRTLAHHAAALWGDGGESKKARAAHAIELAAEVESYGKIKLHDDILEILSGGAFVVGGFPRLVQRFARRMYGLIKYDDADLRLAARGVTDVFIGRGHSVKPMLHGNCHAGEAKPRARCYRKDRLARELASPVVCGDCPYHQMKKVHLRAVQDDLARQRADLALRPPSLVVSSERAALKATEELVVFYENRGEILTSGVA